MSPRVELRSDVYRVAVNDGVYLLSNRGSMKLTGTSIAQWVDVLAPHLDGRYTLAEMTADLSPERRRIVEEILAALKNRGMVRERDDRQPQSPDASDADAEKYPYEVAFVDDFRDWSAAASFSRYRSGRALIIGAGPLVPAVARAALRAGVREAHVVVTDDSTEAQLALVKAEARHRDPDQRLIDHKRSQPAEWEIAGWIDRASVVAQIVGEPPDGYAQWVERHCAERGVPLTQVAIWAGEAWLVPVTEDGAWYWSAARPRLRATSATPGEPDHAAAVVVASQLVQGAFRVITGLEPVSETGALWRVDLNTLRGESHRFQAHPLTLSAAATDDAGFRARVVELTVGERLSEESFSKRAASCVDERTGLVTLHEHDWPQSPLHITEARAHDPTGLLENSDYVAAIGAGLSFRTARAAATLRALAQYAALMIDPRRLVDSAGRPLFLSGDPHQALAALRAGELDGAVRGYALPDPNQVRLAPASVVFPWLRTPTPRSRAPTGITAGFDWDDAVSAGLLEHCRRVTIARLEHTTRPCPAVDLTEATLDTTGIRCRDVLAATGELPAVYDIAELLGVPTYAFCLGAETVAYSNGTSAAAALSKGLVEVLRFVQAQCHGVADILPPTVPTLPPSLRGRSHAQGMADSTADLGVPELAAKLRAAGHATVAVPLDHDPELARILPYIVHVVIVDD